MDEDKLLDCVAEMDEEGRARFAAKVLNTTSLGREVWHGFWEECDESIKGEIQGRISDIIDKE